jgi:hypothetical protein
VTSPPALSEEAMKVGLLLETTETQERLIASSLKQLRSHTEDLDAIVREQIRSSLSEEFGALIEESARATQTLQALKRAAGLRFGSWILGATLILCAAASASAWWLLPSASQIEVLRARQTQLNAAISSLEQRGGRIDMRRCGDSSRWCVRVDRQAPVYGAQSDYYVLKGY